jgi:hypothetical protein
MGAKLLRGFAYVWLCLLGSLIFVSCIAIWHRDGFGKVQEIFSPFNVVNVVVTLITLSPGIAAYMLAEKLEQRAARRLPGAAQPNTSSSLAEVESLIQTYGRRPRSRGCHECRRRRLQSPACTQREDQVRSSCCPTGNAGSQDARTA